MIYVGVQNAKTLKYLLGIGIVGCGYWCEYWWYWYCGRKIIFRATQLSSSPFTKLHIGSLPQYEKLSKQTNFHFSFYSKKC